MTTAASEAEQLRELDEDVRRAWNGYIVQLRELTGEQYEQAERDRWTELQDELKTLEHRRRQLTGD